MEERVSNEVQAQSARQEYLHLKMLSDETMRSYANRAWSLAGSLLETLNEAQAKPQVIKGLPAKM